jgi:hypothetical protein
MFQFFFDAEPYSTTQAEILSVLSARAPSRVIEQVHFGGVSSLCASSLSGRQFQRRDLTEKSAVSEI